MSEARCTCALPFIHRWDAHLHQYPEPAAPPTVEARRCPDCGFTNVEIGDIHINAQEVGRTGRDHLLPRPTAASPDLRAALAWAVSTIEMSDDYHSYCATQQEDGGDCTCGADDMMDKLALAAAPSPEPTDATGIEVSPPVPDGTAGKIGVVTQMGGPESRDTDRGPVVEATGDASRTRYTTDATGTERCGESGCPLPDDREWHAGRSRHNVGGRRMNHPFTPAAPAPKDGAEVCGRHMGLGSECARRPGHDGGHSVYDIDVPFLTPAPSAEETP